MQELIQRVMRAMPAALGCTYLVGAVVMLVVEAYDNREANDNR
jgi:hypothetical protein